jgi:hypothetical protein
MYLLSLKAGQAADAVVNVSLKGPFYCLKPEQPLPLGLAA